MGFIPNFKNDILVSYAHVDDQCLPGTERGWVTTFVDFLQKRLDQKLGRHENYSLWIDDEVGAHGRISDQLFQAISDSAVLLVILSPGYVASEWCRRERHRFFNHVRNTAPRVILVEREAIEETDWPVEFRDLKIFRFWVGERGKPPRILGCPNPDEAYYGRMEDLCFGLVRVLRELKGPTAQAAPSAHQSPSLAPSAIAPQVGPIIFLAVPTYDLDSEWGEVKSYLDQAGVLVMPETRYPMDPETFSALSERDMKHCCCFVQLLSTVPFRKPALSAVDYNQLQLDLAKRLRRPVLQWRHPELDVELVMDKQHRMLLEGGDVQAETLEDFKLAVRTKAFEKPVAPTEKPLNAFVFVNSDSLDRTLADQVCEALQRLGAAWALPRSFSSPGTALDPKVVREDLETNLAACDALIIVYGNSDVDWVRKQLIQCRRAIASREYPLNALAVFEGPPEDKEPLGMQVESMRIVDCRKGFDETELGQFLGAIRGGNKP